LNTIIYHKKLIGFGATHQHTCSLFQETSFETMTLALCTNTIRETFKNTN